MHFLFSPNGRFQRWHYWTVQLLVSTIYIPAQMVLKSINDPTDPPLPETVIFTGFIVVLGGALLLWCQVCAIIKRYHDRGKSGWWWLILFVPLIGVLWQIVECGFLGSEPKDNEYGPGPIVTKGGVEEEIRQLKARNGFGTAKPEKSKPAADRRNGFPPPPKPMFGQGSQS